ncbi:MAG: DUF3320 domain-containing protein [Myxococcota bacterium]
MVTFSQAQQSLVSDLLDEARRNEPQIEGHFAGIDEPVFVKNLENVQGDERDEILFSIGYGPDARGQVAMNFGPLNREGGERRLNVAVTRARRQLRVFSTLTHDRIDLARTRARGVQHLKEFLRYAEASASPPEDSRASRDFVSAFEREVHDVLVERGHEVDVGVGCGEYRIDLAVRDPERPGEYLLGVELDGPAYASGATARDRDRLRPEVLEGLGWRLHRVWSMDWWFDREREVRRIERALSDALAGEPWVDDEPTDSGEEEEEEPPPTPTPDGHDARIEPYVVTELAVVSEDPKSLYDAGQQEAVARAVREVLDVEGPLHLAELTRRVGAAFGQKKLSAKAKRRITTVAKALDPPAAFRDGFVWRGSDDPTWFDRLRGPTADGATRDADAIPPEEVVLAVKLVLTDNLAMPRAELVRQTARLFGLVRLGRKITQAMERGIDQLVAQGGAELQGDRVIGR